MYDLLLRNGRIVDGSGMPSFIGDVGVTGGRIAAIGRLNESASRVLDCEGLVVSPGFIDMHTHYDAQVFWDPLLTSSCWHGITSVIMTNCGFALAPCRPRDRDYLAKTLARVEGMQLAALEEGVPWGWETFAEYLAALEGRIGLNIGSQIGHTALRRYVMGEEANQRPAKDAEISEMSAILRQAMADGAFGFSTSQSQNHYGYYGEPIPSQLAEPDELLSLASVLREFRAGGIEIIPGSIFQGGAFSEADKRLLLDLAFASGRPVNWNELNQGQGDHYRASLKFMEDASRQGAQIFAVSRCQPIDLQVNVEDTLLLRTMPTWKRIIDGTREEKLRAYGDLELRPALREEVKNTPNVHAWVTSAMRITETTLPKNQQYGGRTVADVAAELGKHPVDVMLDLTVEEEFGTGFEVPAMSNTDAAIVGEILKSPHAIVGISDGGAHNDLMIGSEYPTLFLSLWVRDRRLMTLEDGVRQLTAVPAYIAGLRDRGMLREGGAADITVFDYDRLRPAKRTWARDLPGEGRRLVQGAEGYEYSIVNGSVLLQKGQPTGELPGQVLRSARA